MAPASGPGRLLRNSRWPIRGCRYVAAAIAPESRREYTRSDLIGRSVSHYRVFEQLGAGGMGEVYKAHDTHLDRLVALKVLPPQDTEDPERNRRMLQEARAASALNHPNIIQVYDVDTSDGITFIAMEYVEGRPLDQLIPPGGLPFPTVLKYGIQIADGLACAHRAGIVHRDLKPANIMVGSDGQIKLLDFGLAKLAEGAAGAEQVTRTIEGTICGTAAYMSPEQAEGKAVDARSDIFSFGAVLYEMSSGSPAFQATSQVGTLAAVLREEPRPLKRINPEFARLVARCLRKDRERRTQHIDDVRVTLQELAEQYRPGKRRFWPAAAAMILVLLLAIAAGSLLFRREMPPEAVSLPAPLTSYPGDEAQPSFSPDGNQVAFVWNGESQDNPDIYVKLIGGAEKPLRLTSDPAADLSPAWSPDGRWIAFLRDPGRGSGNSAVFLVPAIGGSERLVTELVAPIVTRDGSPHVEWRVAPFPLLAWAPGGQFVIVVDRGAPNEPLGLFVVSTGTGEKRRLTTAPSGYIGDGAPSVAPDGRSLLFSRAARISESDLYQLPLTASLVPGGEPKRVTSLKAWTANPSWLSGAHEILFARGSTYLGPFSLWRMPVSGNTPARRLAVEGNCGWPAFSPKAGRLAFSHSISDSNIWRVSLNNTRAAAPPQRFIASTREDEVPQYSPDGSRVAFTSNRSGVHEVWVSNADSSGPVQLTAFGTGMTGTPKWSPDSKKIVFDGNAEGQFRLYTINASGGTPRPLTRDTVDDALGAFSSDGQRIYFSSGRAGIRQIFYVYADGSEPVQLTRNGGTNPIVSPDGSLVYFWRTHQLWAVPAGGGPENLVLDSVSLFRYAVGAHGIYFVPFCDTSICREIDYFDISSRATHRVVVTDGRMGSGLTISPDEKFLLYTRVEQTDSDLMLIEQFR